MATFTGLTKNTASWTGNAKNASAWTGTNKSLGVNSFLQLETGFYLLQEDGSSKLILENSNPGGITWTGLTKN